MRRRHAWRVRCGAILAGAGLILASGSFSARAQQSQATPGSSGDDSIQVDAATEAVISGALKYLSAQQMPDGSWIGDKNSPGTAKYAVAMTAYTMMAFMANGNLPTEGPYAKQVRNGLQFLLDSVQADGTFNVSDRSYYMYNHGLATMVLAELYGETQNPAIRAKLEHVVLLIIRGQNAEGGWRYQPGSKDADVSVTVPQTVALLAAKRAGIDVPQVTIDRAVAYLKRCQMQPSGGFSYQAGGVQGPAFARSAGAIYALQISGLYDDPVVTQGAKYVMTTIALCNRPNWRPTYMTYGNYYAGVAYYLMGGESWRTYYETFGRQYLLQHVVTEGDMSHWDISLDDRAKDVGSNWCTAVFTTVLSLPYGYLPLYQR